MGVSNKRYEGAGFKGRQWESALETSLGSLPVPWIKGNF